MTQAGTRDAEPMPDIGNLPAATFPDELQHLISALHPGVSPGALWLRSSSQEPEG
jgi:hypothetical protein